MQDIYEINECARNKSFAKITMLQIEINNLREDIKANNTGAITIDEMYKLLNGTIKEYQIWCHIAKLIETNDRARN
ncbi:MAG: hypothetical protein ABF265_09080 [Polaribacter sp.]